MRRGSASGLTKLATAVVVAALLGAGCGSTLDDFNPPSQDKVLRDLENYYAHDSDGRPRPQGELVGCPDREAELWFYCEFDDPSSEATTKITCVHAWIDGPGTYELAYESREIIANVAAARAKAERDSSPVCGLYYSEYPPP